MIKKSWWVDFRANHARYRRRSPENSRAGAQAYEALLRQRLTRGEPMDGSQEQKSVPLFKDFATIWITEYVMPNNKPSEQRNRTYLIHSVLVPFFGNLQINEISGRTIEQYKALKVKAGLSNKTIKNHLSLLNRCLACAYEWLKLTGTPPKIKWPKVAPVEMRFLSFDECQLLLSEARGVDYEMILVALRTGMRQGELRGLQWSSIDWQNQSIAVRYSWDDRSKQLLPPKSNRIRHIPMDVDVYEVLYRRKQASGHVFLDLSGQPFSANRLIERLGKVRTKVRLPNFGWHALRHTFASHLAMRGVPLTIVKDLMGHGSIITTMRYAHLTPSMNRAAIEMLNPKTTLNADFGQPVGNLWIRMQQEELASKQEPPKEAFVLATKRANG